MKRLLLLPLIAAPVACGHGGTAPQYDDQIWKQVDRGTFGQQSLWPEDHQQR